MKNFLGRRAVSLVLALSILFSCMTVLSYAFDGVSLASEESGTTDTVGKGDNILIEADEGVTVQFNRTFDEGYAYSDGFTAAQPKAHKLELADDGTGNKYLRYTAQKAAGATKTADGYLDFYFDRTGDPLDTVVVSFDFLFDKSAGLYPGNLIRIQDFGDGAPVIRALRVDSSGYNFFEKGAKSTYLSKTKNSITYVIENTETATGYTKVIKTYVNGTYLNQDYTYSTTESGYLHWIRIGFFGNPPVGVQFGIDNLKIYSCDETVADPLNVDLGYTMGSSSDRVLYKNELFMKVGIDSVLSCGSKLEGRNEAVTIDGETYIPVDVVAEYLGYTASLSGNKVTLTKSGASTITLNVGSYNASIGSSTVSLTEKVASVDGKYAVMSYKDVENVFSGYYGSYNDMGLIVVSTIEAFATKASDLALVDVMKRFIFNSIDENKSQVDVIDRDTFVEKTSNHPYILANENDFAYYREIYSQGIDNCEDPVLFSYINKLVKSGISAYNSYAAEDANGVCTGPESVPTMPYNDNISNGYDRNGGRQTGAQGVADRMQSLAFAYQITGEENYALLAYYYAIALGEWDHWGPAHFLNCADTAGPFAIAYDWLYDGWTALGLDVAAVTEILFTHGVLAGWYAVTNVECPWARRKRYTATESIDSSHFYRMENNWNAVCSAGMTAAALALAGDLTEIDREITVKKATLVQNTGSNASHYPYVYEYTYPYFHELGDHTGYSTYSDYAYFLFNRIQYTLPLNGLDLYAPDGSYVESPTYWAYSANNLFAVGAYNDSIFGTEFELITNCWGLDETCYYALNAQSSNYSLWNYSDSSNDLVPGAMNTSSFPYVAYQLKNSELEAIRKDMIASGKYSPSYLDVFYYTPGDGSFTLPELQYHMASIDGFVARDSWEPGATYIAIKGGYNDSAHGQVDSGEFVYHNNGKIWFHDIGTEGYNVAGFGGAITGYQYYRMNAEGNNTLALSSDPLIPSAVEGEYENGTKSCFAGQYSYGTGHMYETGDNEFGAYALIDQTSVYYDNAISAKRGMLFTNDRKTVVIQDEVTFKDKETVHWIGHTYQDLYVSTEGRTAYMTDGESTIRVTLISTNEDLRFDVLSAYDFLLQDTHRPEYALENGTGVAEGDRSLFKRLVVNCENVTSLDLAIVIEDVTGDPSMEVGYTYVPMDSWVPTADGRQSNKVDATVDFDENDYGYEVNGELKVYNSYFVSSNMLTVNSNADSAVGDYVAVNFPKSAFLAASLAGDSLVIDADAYTDNVTAGLSLALYGNGAKIASESLANLVTVGGDWSHITIVVNGTTVYFFKDGILVSEHSFHSASFEGTQLAVEVEEASKGTVSLDNVRARKLADTSLDTLVNSGNIYGWSKYVDVAREKALVFFYQTLNNVVISGGSISTDGYTTSDSVGDTPFAPSDFDSAITVRRVYGYTFSQLALNDYTGKEITFYYSNEHAPVAIDRACKIVYGENAFKAESETMSAFVSDGETEFKNESITVYWHIGDTVETSVYSGIAYAEYTGTNNKVGKVTETIVDGKSIFNTTAWSTTEGGKRASKEDMLVTSENCHFYLVDDASDYPYFYETTAGVLVAREDTSTFMADLVAGHNRVILNSDISLREGGRTLSKKAALYLNGHTLDFYGTVSGSHMITIKAGYLAVYGGGGAIKHSGAGNVFFTNSYSTKWGTDGILYAEDLTIDKSGVFMDHRTGKVTFKNVTFNQADTTETTLVIQNRNNKLTGDSMPHIVLDGCTLNNYGSTDSAYAIAVSKNAQLTITGGTHINIPTGIGIRLYNSYTTGGTTTDFVDYDNMSVVVDDAYFNVAELYYLNVVFATTDANGVVSYSAATSAYASKIFSGEFDDRLDDERRTGVLNMASKLQLGNATRSNTNRIPTENIADGCVFARQNDASAPYVSTSDYANVTWVAGSNSVTEYWLNGSIPTADNAEVKANLALLNSTVETGKKYTYSAVEVNGNVTFTARKLTDFGISMSLTLQSSMKVNIFVEKLDTVTVHGFYIDGVAVDYKLDDSKGMECYKIMIPKVLPTSAAVKHEFKVEIDDEDGNLTEVRIYFSVLDYLDKILSDEDKYGREARDLMANILRYIDIAYQYADLTATEDYKAVKTMASKYINKVTYSIVEKTAKPDLSGVTDGVRSVQLLLSDAPKYRFNIKSGYTGRIVLAYTVYGNEITRSFTVTDGLYDGESYIDLELNAYDFRTDITIKTAGGSGVYNLADYYNATSGMDSTLTALLNALYAYSEKAEEYKNLSK